jgi:hypothetical protein
MTTTWSSAETRMRLRTARPLTAKVGASSDPPIPESGPDDRAEPQGHHWATPPLFEHVPVLVSACRGEVAHDAAAVARAAVWSGVVERCAQQGFRWWKLNVMRQVVGRIFARFQTAALRPLTRHRRLTLHRAVLFVRGVMPNRRRPRAAPTRKTPSATYPRRAGASVGVLTPEPPGETRSKPRIVSRTRMEAAATAASSASGSTTGLARHLLIAMQVSMIVDTVSARTSARRHRKPANATDRMFAHTVHQSVCRCGRWREELWCGRAGLWACRSSC